jgi:hypothetical protein
MAQATQYISFCGAFVLPSNTDELQETYQVDESGFCESLVYEAIGGKDSVTVFLSKINNNTGHLVASCPDGNWADECFICLDNNGEPIKAEGNFNPNPVAQII